jgi:hypothetical protein
MPPKPPASREALKGDKLAWGRLVGLDKRAG